ncbi:MAG TPA: DUF4259 domain-containing protein [Rhizobacter sp.]|nr:DUF4259 domain-containing protein [Rhizobacter sp.]
MGTWGVDPFGNDDAVDWVYELEEAEDLGPIEAAIDAVLRAGDDDLEASDASVALAASEVLARLRGQPGEENSYTETVDQWVASTQLKPTVELADRAQAAIARILADNSELKELWQEGDEYDAWLASVDDLRIRLGA